MKKLLKPKDILLLGLAGIGDILEEARDPLSLAASAYKNVYGFIPRRYTRNNFLQMVSRSLKTGDIEKIVKDGKAYLRLTSAGKNKVKRDFPITNLTKKWNKRWVIIIFDIAEKSRKVRDTLREKIRNIGFGMLQESVWITALPIGEDAREFINTLGLSENVFVMEVSHLILGNPKELAKRVWQLDKIEEKYIEIKKEIETVNQLIARLNDRSKQREAKTPKRQKISGHLYELKNKRRVLIKKLLDFVLCLPPVPKQLLPSQLRDLSLFSFGSIKSIV